TWWRRGSSEAIHIALARSGFLHLLCSRTLAKEGWMGLAYGRSNEPQPEPIQSKATPPQPWEVPAEAMQSRVEQQRPTERGLWQRLRSNKLVRALAITAALFLPKKPALAMGDPDTRSAGAMPPQPAASKLVEKGQEIGGSLPTYTELELTLPEELGALSGKYGINVYS